MVNSKLKNYGCKIFITLFLSLLSFISISNADINEGLVGYYPFNGNANDSTLNNHCTVGGAELTNDMNGKNNSAYLFDGVDDYIEKVNPTQNLNIKSQSWTIAAWFKSQKCQSTQVIVSRYECGWSCGPSAGAEALYSLGLKDGSLYYNVRGDNNYGNSGASVTSDETYCDDEWHHVVGILNRDTQLLNLYVDGVIVNSESSKSVGAITDDRNSPLEIGRHFRRSWASSAEYFEGTIDEVRFYNRALSDKEVLELYEYDNKFTLYDSDNDGVVDQWDECPNTTIGLYTNNKGCTAYDVNAAVSGQIVKKGRPINKNGTAMLIQSGEIHQNSILDKNGCFKFESVAEDKPFSVIIRKTIE